MLLNGRSLRHFQGMQPNASALWMPTDPNPIKHSPRKLVQKRYALGCEALDCGRIVGDPRALDMSEKSPYR